MGKYFSIVITLKQAVANAAGIVLFLLLVGINTQWILILAAVFGLLGGTLNDIWSWMRNKDAIKAFNDDKKKDE